MVFDFATQLASGAALPMRHDASLVAMSFLIALFAAYTALEIGGQIAATRGRARAVWVACGAVAMGGGIFSMHFIAMLAMSITIPVSYDIDLTLASLVIAIAFCAAGFLIVARSLRLAALAAGGALTGLGVVSMHYTGMLAMEANARIVYDPFLFALSIVIALVAAPLALWMAFNVRVIWKRLIAAAVMAIAVCGMHYTGMAAASFVPTETVIAGSAWGIPPHDLALVIAAAMSVVLTLFLASLVADRRIASAMAIEAQRLRESEERFRRMFDDAEIPMLVWDLSGTITRANQAMCNFVGYGNAELVGMPAEGIVVSASNQTLNLDDEVEQARTGQLREKSVERRYRHKDGHFVWGISNRSVVNDREGRPVSVISQIQDITARKLAETALAEHEKRFRQTFEDAVIPMVVFDLDGNLVRVNRAMCDFTGYSRRELLNMNALNLVHPSHVAASEEALEVVRDRGLDQSVVEQRLVHKDGHTLWGIANRALLTDDKGNVTSVMSQILDITDRKIAEREKEKLEAELRQTQKLQAIGQLAAGIAHEINTPIQFIGDNLQFIEQSFQPINDVIEAYGDFAEAARGVPHLSERIDALDKIVETADLAFLMTEIPEAARQSHKGIERVARIVSAMKEFSHPGQREKSLADINRALENTIAVCRNEWKHVATLKTDFDPDLPQVPCLVGELNQAFLNLIINASHAIEQAGRAGDGRITVSTRRDNGWVEIRVADNGTGIPPGDRDRIFEPFFTTKDVGKGTGQGLSVTFDVIVNKHGGEIDFETVEGEGTEFIVRLPAVETDAKSKAA